MKKQKRRFSGRIRKRGLLAPVLAVSLLSAPAMADDQAPKSDESGDVFTLGNVEVTGKGESIKNPAVEVVTSEDMLQFDTKTVSEAANLVPGVTLAKGGARNESTVYVRGFDLKHAPLFMDGIPIYVPYDGNVDLGRFFTYDLSELVISKGFASVLYGPNTMGGAINMVSKRPTKEFEGSAGAGYSSVDQYHTFANFGTNQGKWYFQGGGSWFDTNGFEMSDHFHNSTYENGGKRENAKAQDWKVSGKLGLTPNSTDEYALSYIYQNGEKGVPPYAGDNLTNQKKKFWQWPYWRKQSLYFTSNTAIGEKSYVKTRAYYDRFKNSLLIFTDDSYSTVTPNSGNRSWYDDYTYGASIEAGTKLISNNELKLAFLFKDDVHREGDDATGTPQKRFEERIFTIALEDTIKLTDKLSAILGVSYDFQNTVQAQDYNPVVSGGPNVLHDFDRENNSDVNAQAALFYAYSDTGKVHAAVARKNRYPSIKDKYSYRFKTYVPNENLDPEVSNNYEIGVEDTFAKNIRVKSTLFFNDISKYILEVKNVDGTKSQLQNVGHVQRYGYELEANAALTESLEAGMNYTFMYNKNRTSDLVITDLPKHKFFAYGTYSPIKQLKLFASLEYDTRRYSSSDGVDEAGEFVVINTKASYEAIKDLVLEAGINNLLDRDYELTEGYPEAGRTYFVQARYTW